ncbi:NAD(P)H-hydrate dehydratase [Paenibacillus sp. PDC88]|uniref:NAD(P)H-hydrate dehydratase n=1 Tax=Paenibacillus sp. PDC88 TaxID=1884375 RepID=UPI0008989C37|nr:NAD(P)H-hydrate dehydratase [Paenibacillus sp. PDC88]SDX21292.1 NAD(P)H-hydrate epimerase [Paenibacillus sp. PDC88]
MYVVTAKQMRELDHIVIEKIGVPSASLMENAGKALAEEVMKLCREAQNGRIDRRTPGDPLQEDEDNDRRVFEEWRGVRGTIRTEETLHINDRSQEHWYILTGKGNNGGDGLVCARHLQEAGMKVTIVYAVSPSTLEQDAALQRDAAAAYSIPAVVYSEKEPLSFHGVTGIVDALLGTGSNGAPRKAYAALIREANESGLPIVSADIPSGLNADTGELYEPHIRAEITVCFGLLKRGLTQYPGAEAAGRIVVRSIGIPSKLAADQGGTVQVLTEEVLEGSLGMDLALRRSGEGHKGTYGHVLLTAGTLAMSGAGLLSARASLRSGCGLATWALPYELMPHVIGKVPELMLADAVRGNDGLWTEESAERVIQLAEGKDVLAIGPGLGRFEGDTRWLRRIVEACDVPIVLDADALNMAAAGGEDFFLGMSRTAPLILTPHPGEMARLMGISTKDVQRDRITHAEAYAERTGVILVLKGSRTVIAAPSGSTYINLTGHPGMGTGGAGDVLTGIIAGLLAQGWSAEQAAAYGVYLHGLSGERAAYKRHHPGGITAGDIIDAL